MANNINCDIGHDFLVCLASTKFVDINSERCETPLYTPICSKHQDQSVKQRGVGASQATRTRIMYALARPEKKKKRMFVKDYPSEFVRKCELNKQDISIRNKQLEAKWPIGRIEKGKRDGEERPHLPVRIGYDVIASANAISVVAPASNARKHIYHFISLPPMTEQVYE